MLRLASLINFNSASTCPPMLSFELCKSDDETEGRECRRLRHKTYPTIVKNELRTYIICKPTTSNTHARSHSFSHCSVKCLVPAAFIERTILAFVKESLAIIEFMSRRLKSLPIVGCVSSPFRKLRVAP